MSVLIGHASIAETGGVYGQPGDQTGREVCTRSWYANGWDFMALHPDADVRERHARAVEQACANDCIGYSWDSRNTLYQQAKAVGMDISKIAVKCNCDCSSLQNCAAVASGAPGVSYGDNGWVTTNMLQYLRAAGYKIITDKAMLQSDVYCVRGAIYVSSGHTVCALGNGSRANETLAAAGISVGAGVLDGPEDGTPAVVVVPEAVSRVDTCTVKLPVVRRGMTGDAVRAAQLLLIGHGYDCGPDGADGELGPNTEAALLRYQSDCHMEADGVLGPLSWRALICT